MTTTDKVYRWGIIGCGRISYDFCNCLTASPRSEIAACAARNIKSAQSFANKFDIQTAYGSYESLVKDESIDIVYVGTIHKTHYETVLSCLQNGKHVVCEKPMGINYRETKAMIDCARREQVFLLEAVWTRFFPVTKQVKQWINNGKIGTVVSVASDFGVRFKDNTPSRDTYWWSQKLNGGQWLGLGSYLIDSITRVFGPRMPEISALGVVDDKYGVDQLVMANMLYRDSMQYAVIREDIYSTSNEECFIVGTNGVIKIHQMHAPTKVELYQNTLGEKKLIETKEFGLMDSTKFKYDEFICPNSAGLYYEIEEVIRCLDQGLLESPNYKCEEMLINAKISDEIRRQIGLKFDQDTEDSVIQSKL
eukprot:31326_1